MQPDRRRTRRLHISAEDDWINDGLAYEVLDMSHAGVGLRSNQPLRPGERVTLSAEGGLSAELEVVVCNMVMAPDEYTDGEYRLGCKFVTKKSANEFLARVIG